jgi:RNA polymerase sigma-70 factor (ECF subfamily)
MGPTDFTRLYAEHAQPLYAFLSYRTGDRVLAEDLLADTFERVLRSKRGYDRRRGSERTWLYTIALNCVRDNARRTAAESRALARESAGGVARLSVPAASDGFELKQILHEALAALSDDEREVLALRFGADLSLVDIATVLGEPRSTVEARIYRGLRKMRNLVDEESRPATAPVLKRAGEA